MMKLWGSKYNLDLINGLTFNRRQILLKRWVWLEPEINGTKLGFECKFFFILYNFWWFFNVIIRFWIKTSNYLINTQLIFESVQNFLHLLYLSFSRDIFFFQAMVVLTSLWRPYGRIICLRTNLTLWWRSQSVHRA